MTTFQRMQQNANKICHQSGELGVHVPQIMQKRISMIANQNPLNNAKELREIERMVSEKSEAFWESWQEMAMQGFIAQQNLSKLMFDNWVKLSFGKPILLDQLFYQINYETLKVLEKGMYPIHRRVTANAKRLK